MRACPWSESVGEGGGGGVIRITVEPSVAANWVTEGSYIRVYVGRYTLWTASATLLSTRRFRNPSQPPGILLWSARQNAIQNPLSTAIGFRPTHYPFCRPFNLIRHDRHWQHDNRVTWQYFDKDSLRRNICRLQFARVYHHYDGYSNRRPMKGLSNFDAQRFNQVRASSDPWNFSYNQIFSRQIFTKQNIIRIRGMSDVIFPLIFLLWSEHCFCSRYPPIRAAPFVHPSRPFRDRTQDRKRNQRILALLCSSVLTNERLSRDKIAPVDSSLAANPHVWARRISIGEFLRERSRSFSPESKRPSLRAFTETRPQNRKLQFLPNVEERTSENASKFIRDRQIFIGQRRTYTRGNPTFGARPKPLLQPGGGLEYSGPSYSRQRTALRRDITSVHATVILEFIFPLSSFPKKPSTSFSVTLSYARNVISLWISPRVFSRHPLRVRVFIQRLRQIFCLVELHRGQNISVPAFHVEISLKKYLADFGIIKIFEYSLYPNYNESHL